jgi:cell division protein FtsB
VSHNRRVRRDLTRPIPVADQLVRRRRWRWPLAAMVMIVLAALAAALFVLPFQAWWNQQDSLDQRRRELETLTEVNARLEAEIARLNTDAGVIEAARNELGFVQLGERRLALVERNPLGATLPDHWPYSVVDAILDARASHAAAAALADIQGLSDMGDTPAG